MSSATFGNAAKFSLLPLILSLAACGGGGGGSGNAGSESVALAGSTLTSTLSTTAALANTSGNAVAASGTKVATGSVITTNLVASVPVVAAASAVVNTATGVSSNVVVNAGTGTNANVVVTVPTPTPAVSDALPTDAIFAPTSFWYQPIPANVPLHASSTQFAQDFVRQRNSYYNTVAINSWNYASPVYIASADTPTVDIGFLDCQGKGYFDSGLKSQFTAVPLPANAEAANGSDRELTIYDPVNNRLWDFWKFDKASGKACWGGRMLDTKSSNGIFPFPYGTTATGLPFIGGQITAEELRRGEIRHVIGISLVDAAPSNVVSWPAGRSDGNGTGIIPEGTRFRLDPSINVDALSIHPVAKIIAKAAQKYGFVVWDRAGSVSVRFQNPKSYPSDPYPALFNGTPSYNILNGIPWDKLQFMPANYGKP